MKNLVMGVAKGYGWNDIEPFVVSFKKNCPDADLVLFVDDLSDFTENKLKRGGGVQLQQIPNNLKSMIIVCSRFIMYKNFLAKHTKYENIFFTDIGDVIFQDNVFKRYEKFKKFLVYATHPYKIEGEPTNTKWIRNIFSENEYQKIKDNFVICAGVIFGTYSEMMLLLEKITKLMDSNPHWGDDQAILNYLIYNKLLPIENLIESNVMTGDILNLDYPTYTSYKLQIRENEVRNLNGGKPSVVHQWLTQEFIPIVNQIYREKDFQPNENFTDVQSALDQIFCLVQRQNYSTATKFFVEYILYAENLNIYGEKLLKLYQFVLQRYNPDAEILLSAMQQALFSAFRTNINIQQMENLYRLFIATEKNIHVVNSSLKNFIEDMLINFTDVFYKNNQQNNAREYIKRLAKWRNVE